MILPSKPIIFVILSAALAACSQETPTAPDAVSAAAVALGASEPAVASVPQPAAVSAPHVDDAATPKQQAQALHDLMEQFKSEAAQRANAQQDRSQQPSQERARALIEGETAAIRQGIERLKLLNLKDKKVAAVRDAQVTSMQLFTDTAELQLRSILASEQKKFDELSQINQTLGNKIVQSQEWQNSAELQYKTLLKQHKIQP